MRNFFKSFTFVMLVALVSCSKDEINEPLLSVSTSQEINLTPGATEAVIVLVATDQTNWKVVSDQEWCIVTPDYSNSRFTITAQTNTTTVAHAVATITVSALSGTSVVKTTTIKVSQGTIEYGISWVRIPKGEFKMGGTGYAPFLTFVEYPIHNVTLTNDFMMSSCEITNAQYADFLNSKGIIGVPVTVERKVAVDIGAPDEFGNQEDIYSITNVNLIVAKGPTSEGEQIYAFDCTFDPTVPKIGEYWEDPLPHEIGLKWVNNKWVPVAGFENHPMVNVSWYGARAFAQSFGGDLPTEAQWEYACRAGTETLYFYGSNFFGGVSAEYAWAKDWSVGGTTHPVGELLPNQWGLHDVYGNASEICLDRYPLDVINAAGGVTYPATPQINPVKISGNIVMMRGGSYQDGDYETHSAGRSVISTVPFEWNTSYATGFRVVINLK